MGFLFWLFVFFFSSWLFFRVFGRVIVQYLLREVLKKVANEAGNQKKGYERFFEGRAFREKVYVDEEEKKSAPQNKEKRKVSPDEIAEDIDFEDI